MSILKAFVRKCVDSIFSQQTTSFTRMRPDVNLLLERLMLDIFFHLRSNLNIPLFNCVLQCTKACGIFLCQPTEHGIM